MTTFDRLLGEHNVSHRLSEDTTCCPWELARWKCTSNSIVLFFSTTAILGAITRHVTKQMIPTSLVMMATGAIYGLILYYYFPSNVPEFPPQNWTWAFNQLIYIPTVIFNAAFAISARKFINSINVFSLALLFRSVTMITMIGIFVHHLEAEKNLKHSFLFAVMMSVNSSLNISNHLNKLGATKETNTFLCSEASLNNVFLFMVFSITRDILQSPEFRAGEILLIISTLTFCVVWGYLIGRVIIIFMKRMVFDEKKSLLFLMASIYFVASPCLANKYFPSSISILMMTVALRTNEPCIERKLMKPLNMVLCTIIDLIDRVLYLAVGKLVMWIVIMHHRITMHLIVAVVVIYVIIFFSRFLSALILRLIAYKTTITWTISSAVIWTHVSGAPALMLFFVIYTDDIFPRQLSKLDLLMSTGVVILAQVINVTVIETIVQHLGLTIIDISRRASMEYAVQRIQTVIEDSIENNKSCSRFQTTYWKWIEEYTHIGNLYATRKYMMVNYESQRLSNFNQCPICQAEEDSSLVRSKFKAALQPLNVEYAYRTAVAAAKRSYWTQYEERTIEWSSIKKLNEIIHIVKETPRSYMHGRDVIKKMPSTGVYDYLKGALYFISEKFLRKMSPIEQRRALTAKHGAQANLDLWHRLSFMVVFHGWFDLITSIVMLTTVALTIMSLCVSKKPKVLMADGESYFAFALELIFHLCFSLIIAMKATAHTRNTFQDSRWTRFYLAFFSLRSVHTFIEFLEIVGLLEQPAAFVYLMASTRFIFLTHCVRLIYYVEHLFLKYINRGITSRLFENYKLAYGFSVGEEEVRRFLRAHESVKPTETSLKRQIESNMRLVLRELADFHKKHPTVLTAAKTHLASTKVLNDVGPRMEELKYIFISESEYKMLLHVYNEALYNLSKSPKSIPILSNRYHIVRSVEWMDKRIYAVLEKGIRFDTYSAGTTLCKLGNSSEGVYIIISGLVKIAGTPEIMQYTTLPNADSPYYFTENETFQHYLSVRDCLGLLGVLTRGECVTEAKCETDIEVAFIPMKQMQDALEKVKTPPSLYCKLWLLISINISSILLNRLSHYLRYSKQRIREELANATLPCFVNVEEFWKTDEIHDVILIQGCIKNKRGKEVFYGPMYIPRHVTHMYFPGKEKKRANVIVLFLTDENYHLPNELKWSTQTEPKRRRYGRAQTETSLKIMEEMEGEAKQEDETVNDTVSNI